MTLYKYLRKKDLDAFFATGSIKIGTLYEYREVEKYGKVIGDEEEGSYKTVLSKTGPYEVDLSVISPESLFFKQHLNFRIGKGAGKMIMSAGAEFVVTSNSSDLYIYCITNRFDPLVMREFGYDSCLEINRPDLFFKEISRVIRHQAAFGGVEDIIYGEKTAHYTNPHKFHPAIVKSKEYLYQNEVRAIWQPKKEIISPLFIKVRKAIRACSVLKF